VQSCRMSGSGLSVAGSLAVLMALPTGGPTLVGLTSCATAFTGSPISGAKTPHMGGGGELNDD
jgi:hypothetical protein